MISLFVYKFYYLDDYKNEDAIAYENVEIKEKNIKTNNKIKVEIKGAVEKPGVYDFSDNNIINDLVTVAGGFKENAYSDNINLSHKLADEMVIYVYTKKEYSKLNIKEKPVEIKSCKCPEVDISNCIDTGKSVIENKNVSSEDIVSNNNQTNEEIEGTITLININTASINELMTLNGIGEAKAKSIIEYRETNGNFTSLEDIKNVSGISQAIYEKIKNYITI